MEDPTFEVFNISDIIKLLDGFVEIPCNGELEGLKLRANEILREKKLPLKQSTREMIRTEVACIEEALNDGDSNDVDHHLLNILETLKQHG